jgi:hypothetical protein
MSNWDKKKITNKGPNFFVICCDGFHLSEEKVEKLEVDGVAEVILPKNVEHCVGFRLKDTLEEEDWTDNIREENSEGIIMNHPGPEKYINYIVQVVETLERVNINLELAMDPDRANLNIIQILNGFQPAFSPSPSVNDPFLKDDLYEFLSSFVHDIVLLEFHHNIYKLSVIFRKINDTWKFSVLLTFSLISEADASSEILTSSNDSIVEIKFQLRLIRGGEVTMEEIVMDLARSDAQSSLTHQWIKEEFRSRFVALANDDFSVRMISPEIGIDFIDTPDFDFNGTIQDIILANAQITLAFIVDHQLALILPPARPVDCSHVFPQQREVANKLFFHGYCALFGENPTTTVPNEEIIVENLTKKYDCVKFLIMVPMLNTLRQQTMDRVRAFSELFTEANRDTAVQQMVMMYPVTSANSKVLMEQLKENTIKDRKQLLIVVVDECHNAPTQNAIPIIHDHDLCASDNFLVVLISATPFNCLSTQSKVQPENLLIWSDIIANKNRSIYTGFDFYARSIAFRSPVNHIQIREVRFGDEVIIDNLCIDVFHSNREFCGFQGLAMVVQTALQNNQNLTHRGLKCHFVFEKKTSNFKFKVSTVPSRVRGSLCIDREDSLFQYLAFFRNGEEKVLVPFNTDIFSGPASDFNIDENFPLEKQHLREDPSFAKVREILQLSFPELRRVHEESRRRANGNALEPNIMPHVDHAFPMLQPEHHSKLPDGYTLMKSRNGFTIVIDYIFSMCYFAVCHNLEAVKITNHTAYQFVRLLYKCCYFIDNGEMCDIRHLGSRLLQEYLRSGHEEITKIQVLADITGEIQDLDVVRYILHQKKKEEATAANTTATESWYTESDRIIKRLLLRSPLLSPTEDGTQPFAPMILLRVYDNDENLSMQRILRHARDCCFPRIQNMGPNNIVAFSVLGDISGTSIFTSMEDYFKNTFRIRRNGELTTLSKVQRSKTEHVATDLNYQELEGIPMLVLLCEKGRMGDTFPHNFQVFDLRVRTANAATSFIQEIGRLCRYPAFYGEVHEILELTPNGLIGNFNDDEDFQAQYPHGVMVFGVNDRVDEPINVAETLYQLNYVVHATGHEENPYTKWYIKHLKYPLPVALIDGKALAHIGEAVENRESELFDGKPFTETTMESQRRNTPIYPRFRSSPLDSYLTGVRDNMSWFDYPLRASMGHYDTGNVTNMKHPRRLLLGAECQIGKTDAFLKFLSMFAEILNFQEDLPPGPIELRTVFSPQDYYFPHWKKIEDQPRLVYSNVGKGKYHEPLLKQRLFGIMKARDRAQSVSNADAFIFEYMQFLSKTEFVNCAKGVELLRELRNIVVEVDDVIPVNLTNRTTIRSLLDWDGRMKNEACKQLFDEFLTSLEDLDVVLQYEQLAQSSFIGDEIVRQTFWESEPDEETEFIDDLPAAGPPFARITINDTIDRTYESFALRRPPAGLLPSSSVAGSTLRFSCPNFANECNCPHKFIGNFSVFIPSRLAQRPNKWSDLTMLQKAFGDWINAGLKMQKVIRNIMFTPSYAGKNGIEDKYLLRGNKAMTLPNGQVLEVFKDYLQVIVVRQDQFDLYRTAFGEQYVIVSLPTKLKVSDYIGIHANGNFEVSDSQGGPGYARLFIQVFAEKLGLEEIWFIDDNVKSCYKMHWETQSSIKPSFRSASMAEVMVDIESLLRTAMEDDNSDRRLDGRLTDDFANHHLLYSSAAPANWEVHRNNLVSNGALASNLTEYIGDKGSYGVIGMSRCLQHRNVISNPIKLTHSVYSFYLFNVKAAKDKEAYYPPRKTMEDIEMNFLLYEKGLAVIKLQMYCHRKPWRVLRSSIPPPPPPPNVIEVLRDVLNDPSCRIERRIYLDDDMAFVQGLDSSMRMQYTHLQNYSVNIGTHPFILMFSGQEMDQFWAKLELKNRSFGERNPFYVITFPEVNVTCAYSQRIETFFNDRKLIIYLLNAGASDDEKKSPLKRGPDHDQDQPSKVRNIGSSFSSSTL